MKFKLIVLTPNLGLSSKKVDQLNLQMIFLFFLVKSRNGNTFSNSSNECQTMYYNKDGNFLHF